MITGTTKTIVYPDGFFTQFNVKTWPQYAPNGQSILLKNLVSQQELESMSHKLHQYDSELNLDWLTEQRVQAMAQRSYTKLFELDSDHVITIHQNGSCHVYIAGCDGPFFEEFACDWVDEGLNLSQDSIFSTLN